MATKNITVPVYSLAGEKVSDLTLDASVFGVKENKQVMYDAVKVYQANMRQDTAKTKKRDEVSGGGKKPWRQKGTGRARAGSSRSPIWVGGGTVFGPTGVQNHKLAQNRKEHALALRCAYSSKVKDLVVVDSFKVSKVSTKDFAKSLSGLKATGKVLLILSEDNEKLILSAQNIAGLVITSANNVSVYDLMYFDHLVMDTATIKLVEESLKEGK
ncbi:MAG: 50S ribosomal protein L4 [Bacilli bacterium]|nr:50S ribosomal protein L4 [Bacilli bacterium]